MKNLSPSPISNSSIQSLTPQGSYTKFIQPSIILSRANVIFQEKSKRKLEVHEMTLQKANSQKFTQIHQWRRKTSLPIVKSYLLRVINEKIDLISIEFYHEYIPFRLNQLKNIPFTNGLYILKQSLIGFQRLIEKFGYFFPTVKMIGINENNKCRVWFNQNFHENKLISDHLNEQEFCSQLINIVGQHIAHNEISGYLWQKFRTNPSFIGLIKQIKAFQNQNGKLSNQLDLLQMDQDNNSRGPTNIIKQRKGSMKYSNNSFLKKKNIIPYQSQINKTLEIQKAQNKTLGITNTSDYANYSPNNRRNVNKSQTSHNQYDSPNSPRRNSNSTFKCFKSNLKAKAKSMFRSTEIQDILLCHKPKKQRIRKFSVKDQHEFYNQQNPEKRISRYEQQEQIDLQKKIKIKELLTNNGWEKKIGNILSTKNVKDSIIEGGDEVLQRVIKCDKLDVFANNMVVSSLIPDQQ